jgi:predicted O-methyltransferase YrrM
MSKYEIPNIPGWMGNNEIQWLYKKATEMESIVEIGVWMGKSTHALLSGCKGIVYAVDHFMGSLDERGSTHHEATQRDISVDFFKYVGHFQNLKLIRGESIEAAKQFEPKSIDMIFIDGDHSKPAFRADMLAWLPICKKLICGHDAHTGGVSDTLKELWEEGKLPRERTIPVDSIWSIEI